MVRRKTWLIIACPCSKSVTIFIQSFFGGAVEDFHQKKSNFLSEFRLLGILMNQEPYKTANTRCLPRVRLVT